MKVLGSSGLRAQSSPLHKAVSTDGGSFMPSPSNLKSIDQLDRVELIMELNVIAGTKGWGFQL